MQSAKSVVALKASSGFGCCHSRSQGSPESFDLTTTLHPGVVALRFKGDRGCVVEERGCLEDGFLSLEVANVL